MTTYGSLFSGVGGFELGLNRLNWQCKWMCEKDKYAADVLKHHWPETPLFTDVCDVDGSIIRPVDIIVGGFPCQDLSNAGLKAGLTGNKSSMFYEYVRIVSEMREATNGEYPKAIIWENVPGILNKGKNWISSVYTAWSEIGAMVQEHRSINAQNFGVAQRRARVIGVAIFDPRADCGREILFDTNPVYGNLDKIGAKRKSSSGTSTQVFDTVIPFDTTQITSPQNKSVPTNGSLMHTLSASAHAPKICYSITPVGGQGADLVAKQVDIGNTLTAIAAPDRGIKVVDKGVRQLSLVEMERLMGWPDDWTSLGANKPISDHQRRKMCGNGIVAYCAEWAGRRLEIFLHELEIAPSES